jgi:hypothetical protein
VERSQVRSVFTNKMLITRIGLVTLSLAVTACSAQDSDPSPVFDGRYVGTRHSDRLDECGINNPAGTTSALVAQGHLTMPLFGPRTQLAGTVGDDGRVRASGIWPNPTHGFPGVTVLDGHLKNEALEGTASDFRCHTDVRLRKVVPPTSRSTARRPP